MEELDLIRAPFGTEGGRHRQKKYIIPILPPHKVYIEPFCGAASVFFAKDPVEREYLNDKDEGIIATLRFIKHHTDKDFELLRSFDWRPSRRLFEELLQKEFKADIRKAYRNLYLRCYSFGANTKEYAPKYEKESTRFPNKEALEQVSKRLKSTKISCGDYSGMSKYDSPDTLYFIDPPYRTDDLKCHGLFGEIDYSDLSKWVGNLKGKWLLTCGMAPSIAKAFQGYNLRKVLLSGTHQKYGECSNRQELWISNFSFQLSKEIQLASQIMIHDPLAYHAEAKSDDVLAEDWRLACAWWEQVLTNPNFKYTRDQVLEVGARILRELVVRGKITFHPGEYTDAGMDLLIESLKKIVKKGLYLPPSSANAIADGTKKAIVRVGDREQDMGFLGLVSDGQVHGFIRLAPPKTMDQAAYFDAAKDHGIPEEDRAARAKRVPEWGTGPYLLYPIREWVPLPRPARMPMTDSAKEKVYQAETTLGILNPMNLTARLVAGIPVHDLMAAREMGGMENRGAAPWNLIEMELMRRGINGHPGKRETAPGTTETGVVGTNHDKAGSNRSCNETTLPSATGIDRERQ